MCLLWQLAPEIWIYQDPDDYVMEDNDQKSYLYLQISFMFALLFATIDFVEWHDTRNGDWEPVVITTIPALIYRLNLEEQFLIHHFADEYLAYMQKTKKMIPGIW